ncbi:MAG TPA: T9SS type A sorting domain-containing protein [Bacteroidales bacterium]|nr:T9SS type A sorting domain-containing protein [Bacteroidales bacterium]HRZ20192.1 T9SS type A sorting domain-containing protein [Bacteroidales bacterium]
MKTLFLVIIALIPSFMAQAQWEDDVRLTETPDTSFLCWSPGHGIVTNGDTVHVVWYEKIEDSWEIFYKRSTDNGVNWEPDTRLTYAGEFSKNPSISVTGSMVYVVWDETVEGTRDIFFTRSINGGHSWAEQTRLTGGFQSSRHPRIASDGYNVHVAWHIYDALQDIYGIHYMNSTDGGLHWSEDKWLTPDQTYAYNATLAISGSEVHIAWNDASEGTFQIFYRKSSDNGTTWGPEIQLTYDSFTSYAAVPSIAVSGNSVNIVWEDTRDGTFGIYFKGSIDGGESWGEDIWITDYDMESRFPNLALSDSVLHVVWQEWQWGSNEYNEIYYDHSTDGGETWIKNTWLNDYSSSSEHPQIAVSGTVLHVIWADYRDDNYEIYYKRNPTGGVFTGIPAVETMQAVFPNPSNGIFSLRLINSNTEDLVIRIVNTCGQTIYERANVNLPENQSFQIDLTGVQDGIYFLEIEYDHQIQSHKIIIKK